MYDRTEGSSGGGGKAARFAYSRANNAAGRSIAMTRWYMREADLGHPPRKISFTPTPSIGNRLFKGVSTQSNPTAEACFGIVDAGPHRL
jgi:hypothetical protein